MEHIDKSDVLEMARDCDGFMEQDVNVSQTINQSSLTVEHERTTHNTREEVETAREVVSEIPDASPTEITENINTHPTDHNDEDSEEYDYGISDWYSGVDSDDYTDRYTEEDNDERSDEYTEECSDEYVDERSDESSEEYGEKVSGGCSDDSSDEHTEGSNEGDRGDSNEWAEWAS